MVLVTYITKNLLTIVTRLIKHDHDSCHCYFQGLGHYTFYQFNISSIKKRKHGYWLNLFGRTSIEIASNRDCFISSHKFSIPMLISNYFMASYSLEKPKLFIQSRCKKCPHIKAFVIVSQKKFQTKWVVHMFTRSNCYVNTMKTLKTKSTRLDNQNWVVR